MRKWFCFWWASLLATGCTQPSADPSSQPTNKKLQAVATVGMVADVVRNVGKDHVEVVQLMGAGVDPHLYMTTRDDVATLMNADVVFYCGLMLEGKMADTLVKIGRNKPVYAVTEKIDPKYLLEPEGQEGHFDPHVWMDVEAWSTTVTVVAEALSELAPEHKAEFEANAKQYQESLQELHEYGKKVIASIPEPSRILITSHDAFNYFGRAYGLQVMGIQGISTESEAGLQRVNELVDLIVNQKIAAVFVESSVSPKNMEALIDGAKAKEHSVKIGGELFSDAMGEQGTYEGTYVGMLDHNFTTVARALGGSAPEKGMQGKLAGQ